MNERATKKQKELLNYIDGFIKGNGYGPSYREIMRALDYKSVSTVATHVEGLVAAGYLRKGGNTARSLEVVKSDSTVAANTQQHKDWLTRELRKKLSVTPLPSAEDKAAIERIARLFGLAL